jgi:hypothetical protein
MMAPNCFYFVKLFMASVVVLSLLPEIYTLYGKGGGIRTRVSNASATANSISAITLLLGTKFILRFGQCLIFLILITIIFIFFEKNIHFPFPTWWE